MSKRVKSLMACNVCRAQKKKCDSNGVPPCTRCLEKGMGHMCEFREQPRLPAPKRPRSSEDFAFYDPYHRTFHTTAGAGPPPPGFSALPDGFSHFELGPNLPPPAGSFDQKAQGPSPAQASPWGESATGWGAGAWPPNLAGHPAPPENTYSNPPIGSSPESSMSLPPPPAPLPSLRSPQTSPPDKHFLTLPPLDAGSKGSLRSLLNFVHDDQFCSPRQTAPQQLPQPGGPTERHASVNFRKSSIADLLGSSSFPQNDHTTAIDVLSSLCVDVPSTSSARGSLSCAPLESPFHQARESELGRLASSASDFSNLKQLAQSPASTPTAIEPPADSGLLQLADQPPLHQIKQEEPDSSIFPPFLSPLPLNGHTQPSPQSNIM